MLNLLPQHLLFHIFFQDGGAFLATGISALEVSNCTFDHNYAARHGGALSCKPCNTLNINASTFRDNAAEAIGGSVHSEGHGSAQVIDSFFDTGMAASGAGIALLQDQGHSSATASGSAGGASSNQEAAVILQGIRFSNLRAQLDNKRSLTAGTEGPSGELEGHGRKLFMSSEGRKLMRPIPLYDASLWAVEGMGAASDGRVGGNGGLSELNCRSSGAGGAVCIEMGGTMTAGGVIMTNNTARYGGRSCLGHCSRLHCAGVFQAHSHGNIVCSIEGFFLNQHLWLCCWRE
jgi:predicted outer membrane repeat protein